MSQGLTDLKSAHVVASHLQREVMAVYLKIADEGTTRLVGL